MQVAYAAAYDIIKRIKRFEEYKAMKSHIHLIRHGITEGNLNRWYYGAKDIPLVDQGIAALKASAAEGIYPDLADSDIYTSGMLRCIQTLNAIYGDIEYTIIPELRESTAVSLNARATRSFSPMRDMSYGAMTKQAICLCPEEKAETDFLQECIRDLKSFSKGTSSKCFR